MAEDDSKGAFAQRLFHARKAKYPEASQFIRELNEREPGIITKDGYYKYETGQRRPNSQRLMELIAELLNVTVEWLLFGNGKVVNAPQLNAQTVPVNQALESLNINPSQFGRIRYIPILSASEIRLMLSGNGEPASMTGEHLPVAQSIAAGPRTFSYTIPQGDSSMLAAAGPSFPAGTLLIVDRDRVVMPGEFLLCWPPAMPSPILRQLQAAFPLQPGALRFPFTLVALNSMFGPITVHSEEECPIIGRMITDMRIW